MTSFDYIVVGAGSAGAVVAARLAESPGNRVLLIEAGGSHKHMNVQVPAAFSKQFKTKLDWSYFSEPEPYLGGRTDLHATSQDARRLLLDERHDLHPRQQGRL